MLQTQQDFFSYEIQQGRYYDLSACQPTPSEYIHWEVRVKEEASDEEITRYAAQSEAFKFLAEPEEDIYSCDDGKPL